MAANGLGLRVVLVGQRREQSAGFMKVWNNLHAPRKKQPGLRIQFRETRAGQAMRRMMAINKNWVAVTAEHDGRRYYFCVDECRRHFEEDPRRSAKAAMTPA